MSPSRISSISVGRGPGRPAFDAAALAFLQQAELVHDFERRGVSRVATKVAQKISVLLGNQDLYSGSCQRVLASSGWSSAYDAASERSSWRFPALAFVRSALAGSKMIGAFVRLAPHRFTRFTASVKPKRWSRRNFPLPALSTKDASLRRHWCSPGAIGSRDCRSRAGWAKFTAPTT